MLSAGIHATCRAVTGGLLAGIATTLDGGAQPGPMDNDPPMRV
ncbi:hypothetical protein [Nocardia wallacei]|nr:hypothetical protein [Nocardia wallacei]